MSSKTKSEAEKRRALPPPRSYEVPGGPYTKNLGEVEVAVLSEIARGGPEDIAR